MNFNSKNLVLFAMLFAALALAAISIPMILEQIEPNKAYGFRIEKAFESEEAWYAINKYAGWAMVWSAGFMILANLILWYFRRKFNDLVYSLIASGILLLGVLVATFITYNFANQINP